MCPRFVFLLIMWVISWLRLSQREEARQTAETLILRHQLVVLQRRQPRLCVPKTSSRPGQLPCHRRAELVRAGNGYGTVPRGTTHCTGWLVTWAIRS